MNAQDRVARKVVVRGLVQGVFFRGACRQKAFEVDVDGWVSNEYDGNVHAVLEGPPDAVERLVSWMHEGPPNAIVEHVDVQDTRVQGLRGFEVR
jgi:acylphosphatase